MEREKLRKKTAMDRRATKNRKLKFLTFEKLLNFMVPKTNELEVPNVSLVKKALFRFEETSADRVARVPRGGSEVLAEEDSDSQAENIDLV